MGVFAVNVDDGFEPIASSIGFSHVPDWHFTLNAFGAYLMSGEAVNVLAGDDLFIDDVSYSGLSDEHAGWPSPMHNSTGISPEVVLSWDPGASATSHNVYFGTNRAAVAVADTTWSEFRGNQAGTSYDPPEPLVLGQTYYWRVDEVGAAETVKGALFTFTVETGVASDPVPAHNAVATVDALLSWTAGYQSVSHNVRCRCQYDFTGISGQPGRYDIRSRHAFRCFQVLLAHRRGWRNRRTAGASGTGRGDQGRCVDIRNGRLRPAQGGSR
jgi:hypothetical protein